MTKRLIPAAKSSGSPCQNRLRGSLFVPYHLAREAIALCLVLEKHAASLFGRGARPAGILQYSKALTADLLERLRESFQKFYAGGDNAGRTAILENGMTFTPLQLSSVDSQFLEMRRFAVAEISRVFRAPLYMLAELERATHSNAETLGREFVSYTLLPYLRIWEGAIRISLLEPDERGKYFPEFMTDSLLQGDTQSRFAAYQSSLLSGWMTVNEVRGKENLLPVEGGDVIRVPVNTAPAAGQQQQEMAA